MKYKRCLLLMLMLCTVLSMLPAEASATDTSVEQQIIDACTYGETVDISQFRLTAIKLEALHQKLLLEGKLPWYTDQGLSAARILPADRFPDVCRRKSPSRLGNRHHLYGHRVFQ